MGLAVIKWLPNIGLSLEIWAWALVALFLTGLLGFLLGACSVWLSARVRFNRAKKDQHRLVPVVQENLQAAMDAVSALKDYRHLILSDSETAALSQKRDALVTVLGEIVELQQQVSAAISGKPVQSRQSVQSSPYELTWQREPMDEESKLPAAMGMADNLNAMLSLTTEHGQPSGFLFLKVDGYPALAERYGEEAVQTLFRKFAGVVIRSVREEDLVCRCEPDVLAVLFPSLEQNQGTQLAHAVRKSVLSHNFRISESGPAVILNVSYGYSDCLPHENEDLILNRAGNALEKSQRKGKNQLHAHDGDSLHHLGSG